MSGGGWKWNGGAHLITERRSPFFFKIKKRKREREKRITSEILSL
jgi:hypothetical protein